MKRNDLEDILINEKKCNCFISGFKLFWIAQ